MIMEDRYSVQRLTEQICLSGERESADEEPGPNDRLVRLFDINHDAYLSPAHVNTSQKKRAEPIGLLGTVSSFEKNKAMKKPFSEQSEHLPQRNMGRAHAYSAHIQEAMRYDKLRSADYPLVMTILHAQSQGYTEEQWKEEQQRSVQALLQLPPEAGSLHADAANRYEQTVHSLKDLALWPW